MVRLVERARHRFEHVHLGRPEFVAGEGAAERAARPQHGRQLGVIDRLRMLLGHEGSVERIGWSSGLLGANCSSESGPAAPRTAPDAINASRKTSAGGTWSRCGGMAIVGQAWVSAAGGMTRPVGVLLMVTEPQSLRSHTQGP